MGDPEFPRSFPQRSLWRRALAQQAGENLWRDLQAGEPAASELRRRELMRLMGASVVMTGLAGCTDLPRERVLPYSKSPPALTPGVPAYYATSLVLDGFATGLLARSNDGRPTKIEGNPQHPASLGATRPLDQASVLSLYSPARLRAPRVARGPADWSQALASAVAQARRGAPPWFVLHPQSSPTSIELCERVREQLPGARFAFHSPLSRSAAHAATRALFGQRLEAQYDFTRARVVVDLASDFLSAMPMSLRWARDFAVSRRATEPGQGMNRLYSAEAMPSPTGSLADHRLPLRPSRMTALALSLLGEVLVQDPTLVVQPVLAGLPGAEASIDPAWVRAAAGDLLAARGGSAVVVGDRLPAECQLACHVLNLLLGNLGSTLSFCESPLEDERAGESLSDLVSAAQAGQVGSVIILGPNPVYTAPPELELGSWLARIPSTLHLTPSSNETSAVCRTVLPESHYLESWGEARAYDGTLSFVQPLIEPLHPSRSVMEVLSAFSGGAARRGFELLEAAWRARPGSAISRRRDELLRLGFEPGSAFSAVRVAPDWDALGRALQTARSQQGTPRLELNLQPSPAIYDGRFAGNAWLQELPHPVTKQTWGNAAILGPRTAAAYGIETSRLVAVSAGGRQIELPAFVATGHAEGVVSIELGYGQQGEPLTRGVGRNAFALMRSGPAPLGVTLSRREGHDHLAVTQSYFQPGPRPLGLSATLASYHADPDFTSHERKRQLSLLPADDYRGTQWGMTIDTTICTGCSSCVVACQAENNVPVVGKAGVQRGREMHWLRIDRYQRGSSERPEVINQPMLCQHCEKAPCEYVCPVNATVHSPDGLNEMVYNRCVGTRFCSNNCPYKVRRFNWFKYTDSEPGERLVRNPAVTVRERGVMEKCTFCVQRVRAAEIRGRVERRPIREAEVVTACQQACPTQAIQFGSLSHESAPVVSWRRVPRRYAVLHELNTLPRVQYLAKISNTHPALKEPT